MATHASHSLNDRHELVGSPVLATGFQAQIQLPMEQAHGRTAVRLRIKWDIQAGFGTTLKPGSPPGGMLRG